MKKILLFSFLLFSLSAISQIRIDQTKSVSAAGTIGIGKTIIANGSGGWTFETITIPTFDWKADTTWVLNKNYLQSETPQNLSLSGNTISLSGSSSTVNIAASTSVAANSAKVSNATHTGDATGSTALTVVGINNTNLAGLATGILKNTTGSGTPSIATSSDFKTINGTSVLGGGSITVGGDVTKVGTPVNNQLGVWTGNGTIEGNSNLTWDGQILGLSGATSSSAVIKWKDEDYPTVSLLQEFNAGQMTFGVGTAGNEYATLWVNQSGIRTSGLHLNAYSYPAYDDEGSIRYRNLGGGVYDFQGNVNGTWMSLTTGGSGSGMTDPMTTRGDIITRDASNTTSRLGLGTSGQYLQSNGTDLIWGSAPAGSSQWTTQSNGITYGGNVGIGASADASVRFNLLSTVATAPAAYIKNSSTTGHGLWVYGGSTSDQAALFVADYNGANSFLNIRGNGDILLPNLKEDAAPANVVYYNTTTKALSYGVKPTGGTGGSGTVTSFSAGDISGLFTTTETNPTTTPVLSFTLNNQAQNRVYASPYGSSGTPSFRALDTNDLPNTSVTPGSYTASNITVDSKGRITAASSGSGGSGMTYPAAGIALSTGSAWGSSITNNSANWNAAVTNMGKSSVSPGSYYYLSSSYFAAEDNYIIPILSSVIANNIPVSPTTTAVYNSLLNKQNTLVSGSNIRPVNGRSLLGADDINLPLTKTANTSFSLDMSATTNVTVSTANNIGITFANVKNGATGNIEVIYTTGASNAIVTFYTDVTTYTFYVQPSIHGGGASNQKYVLGMNAGSRAVYSYWVVGDRIYINGTQTYL